MCYALNVSNEDEISRNVCNAGSKRVIINENIFCEKGGLQMPETLDWIKATFNTAGKKLTKKQIHILKYIAENEDKIIYMTLRQLCTAVGCSQVTILRMCTQLGYDGFVDFRAVLRSAREGRRVHSGAGEAGDLFVQVIDNEKKLFSAFLENISSEDITSCASRIAAADFVLILGSGLSSVIGQTLSFRLAQCSINNTVIDPHLNWNGARQMLRALGEKSAVIAISYPMYNHNQAQLVHIAGDTGAFRIAITDSLKAPAALASDKTLICPLSGGNVYNSFVTPMEMVNLLIHSIVIKMGVTYKKPGASDEDQMITEI